VKPLSSRFRSAFLVLFSFFVIPFGNVLAQQGQGDLWALGNTSGAGGDPMSIYLLDQTTAASTLVASTSTAGLRGLAIDPTTGQMYSSYGSPNNTPNTGIVEIDKATGAVTAIGGTKYIVGLAFDSAGQLYGVENAGRGEGNIYTIDKTTGAESFLATVSADSNPYGSDLAFDSSTQTLYLKGWPGGLWSVNTSTGDSTFLGLINLPYSTSKGFDFTESGDMFLHEHPCSTCGDGLSSATSADIFNPMNIASSGVRVWSLAYHGVGLEKVDPVLRVKVTKIFSDGNDAEVEVTLTCNGGLPLQQSFDISGGDPAGVTFSVTNLPQSGVNCEVTESGGLDNYTPQFNGGTGCSWSGLTSGMQTCEILNQATPATYTVESVWIVTPDDAGAVDQNSIFTINCDRDITHVDSTPITPVNEYITSLANGEDVTMTVDSTSGSATCSATQELLQSGVEPEASEACESTQLGAGTSTTCTFTNTLFFEGIPTLNHYGLALLMLLTMGIGIVSFRNQPA
jgi:hypothetical protein